MAAKANPKYVEFEALWKKADEAAKFAVSMGAPPRPMVVGERENPFDDSSPFVPQHYVPSGVCGFAWVKVFPGNAPFANFCVKTGKCQGRSEYGGGRTVKWVSEYGQSMELKEKYAEEFAKVLQAAGIKAYAGSRMD